MQLFLETVKLAENAHPDKHGYSAYGIKIDTRSSNPIKV